MSGLALTLEDVLAAARCVAYWQRAGGRPAAFAARIHGAASRAARFRDRTGLIEPRLGDGSLMAAAHSLMPGKPDAARPLTTAEIIAALGPVCCVVSRSSG